MRETEEDVVRSREVSRIERHPPDKQAGVERKEMLRDEHAARPPLSFHRWDALDPYPSGFSLMGQRREWKPTEHYFERALQKACSGIEVEGIFFSNGLSYVGLLTGSGIKTQPQKCRPNVGTVCLNNQFNPPAPEKEVFPPNHKRALQIISVRQLTFIPRRGRHLIGSLIFLGGLGLWKA